VELLDDPELAKIEGRIETDRYGHAVMTPPPGQRHGRYQSEIAYLLRMRLPRGGVWTECPISTADGVKAADVAWASPAAIEALGDRKLFLRAPELCVEVRSPDNTEAELREKAALYFDAGAEEVWICSEAGAITCLGPSQPAPLEESRLCPGFPKQISLAV
jgi:Uma2 family endonuclease